jgi:hypothetical protein
MSILIGLRAADPVARQGLPRVLAEWIDGCLESLEPLG